MGMRVTELSCKEVVCICDGARLGYVSDVEVEVPEGRCGPSWCRANAGGSASSATPRTM